MRGRPTAASATMPASGTIMYQKKYATPRTE
jgi:hypothetical protein